jgi:tetratricopeptide (TPR) repeat protein
MAKTNFSTSLRAAVTVAVVGVQAIAATSPRLAVGQTAPPAAPATAPQAPAGTAPKPKDDAERRRLAYQTYLEAERLAGDGEYLQAVESYRKAIELAPDEDEPRAALAQLYLRNHNLAEARTAALDATKVNAKSVPARSVLAHIALTEAIVGGSLDPQKSQRAIAEIEELTLLDEKAQMQLGSQSIRALAVLGELYKVVKDDTKATATFERLTRVDSQQSNSFLALARLYFKQNKYREASKAAEQARRLEPTNLDVLDVLAQCYIRSGRTSEALDVYKQALEVSNDAVKDVIRLKLADSLMRVGKYTEAIESVKPILAVQPKNIAAVRVVADASRRSGNREQAAKAIEAALVGQDVIESLELVFVLAETYEEMEQFDKAVATYEEALAALVNPDGTVSEDDRQNAGVIFRRIALAHRLAGRPAKITETFDRMRKALGTSDALPDLAEIQNALETANYDLAVTLSRKGAERFTGDERRTVLFAQAQAMGKKGETEAAVKLLEGMLDKTPSDIDVYAVMAVVQLDGADAMGAERSVRKALEIEPDDTGLLITLSSVQDRAKQYAASEASLRKVLAVDPDNATALNNLGYFLTERKERLEEALTLIQRAVTIEPTNGSYLDSLGWLYFQMGKTTEAQKYLEQAAVYEHRSSTIREHLGDLYDKLGQGAKAREHWAAALRLANEADEISRLKGKLKEPPAKP